MTTLYCMGDGHCGHGNSFWADKYKNSSNFIKILPAAAYSSFFFLRKPRWLLGLRSRPPRGPPAPPILVSSPDPHTAAADGLYHCYVKSGCNCKSGWGRDYTNCAVHDRVIHCNWPHHFLLASVAAVLCSLKGM